MMDVINGGVCAAKGFLASGIHCGIRGNKIKKDLAIIVSNVPAATAAVYSKNLVKGAPLVVTRKNLRNGSARAIICNSGNANTCNANGVHVAETMCELTAKYLNISAEDVVVASTGVIGQELPIDTIAKGMPLLADTLSETGSRDAASAIMTTDTRVKEMAVTFKLGNTVCHLGGIAKGSGMIHPNMATLLVFLTTDVNISEAMLKKALLNDAEESFNMVTIDGDTSTNDMCVIMANGMANNNKIENDNEAFKVFCYALSYVTTALCRMIAKDGEGATKSITVHVSGAADTISARIIAKAVAASNLVKAAMFAADANWGRILCAIGYADVQIDVDAIDVGFSSKSGSVLVCSAGQGVQFNEDVGKNILSADEVDINIALNMGTFSASAWGCDLTYEYIRINGSYRT